MFSSALSFRYRMCVDYYKILCNKSKVMKGHVMRVSYQHHANQHIKFWPPKAKRQKVGSFVDFYIWTHRSWMLTPWLPDCDWSSYYEPHNTGTAERPFVWLRHAVANSAIWWLKHHKRISIKDLLWMLWDLVRLTGWSVAKEMINRTFKDTCYGTIYRMSAWIRAHYELSFGHTC